MKRFIQTYSTKKITILFLFFLVPLLSLNCQIKEETVLNNYEDFAGSTRELVYVHINKTTYLENEMLGFNAYILDKNKKNSLTITKNLYCTIVNEKDKIIKSKLIKVENGLSYNAFVIDSLFTTGNYKFRAYTNWMLNFNERNYYEHSFFVIDSKTKNTQKKVESNKEYTIQILPEGGHLVSEIKNNIGIIVKDKNGFGLKNGTGKIVNNKGELIREFTLNQFGIGKVSFTPIFNNNYRAIINENDNQISGDIKNIENTGIALSVSDLRDKVGITFKINYQTKEIVKNKKYFLAIHNGNNLKSLPFEFNEKTEISKILNKEDLYPGINIFTVFDTEKNKPILERLFFNSNGILQAKLTKTETIIEKSDSITVKIQLDNIIDLQKTQNISISALPNKSKSYNFNSNILSQLYLEPYVRGFVQNSSYYFSNNSAKTKYDLDNLLITQGWSSYNWEDIFKKPEYPNKFEQGINIVANLNSNKSKGFLVYPLKNNKTQIFTLGEEEKAFIHTNLFPEDNEIYKISLLDKKASNKKPKLYLQFYPATIPPLSIKSYDIPFINNIQSNEIKNFKLDFKNSSGIELLDEIVIEANTKQARMEKIKNNSTGKVVFFTDEDSRSGQTLTTFLSLNGWFATDSDGFLQIINPNPNTPNNNIPLVILDDVQLGDFSFLANFQLNIVDYIETSKSGIGYGLRGGGGVIKIVTDPVKRLNANSTNKQEVASYKFPITFSSPKQYYTPIYENYTSQFFRDYGTISWFPNLKVDEKGVITFKILNTFTSAIDLHLEGIINNETFISESKTIYPQ